MDWPVFIIFLAASCGAAATGAMFSPGVWYDRLSKPIWTPPGFAFPIAWTIIYLCSSIAATRIAAVEGNAMAMAFWAMQIAFNTLWTPVFFGLHRIKAALVVMAGLWVAVAGMVATFWALDPVAAYLVLPYIAWVTVAGALNLEVVRRNPDVVPVVP